MEINIPFTHKVLKLSIFKFDPASQHGLVVYEFSLKTFLMHKGTVRQYREFILEWIVMNNHIMLDIVLFPHYEYVGEINDDEYL